jgi:hypothetical protein
MFATIAAKIAPAKKLYMYRIVTPIIHRVVGNPWYIPQVQTDFLTLTIPTTTRYP